MPQMEWLNPATSTYQARRWASRRRQRPAGGFGSGGGSTPTPDPGSQTENIRVDPAVANVAFVTTSVSQPYPESAVVVYPSSLVRPDPVNPAVAWLTVTETGP